MYFWPQLFKRWMAIALPGEKLFKIFKGPWRSAQASFEDLIKIQKRWINAIHWINHYPVHCIVIYPVDSVIHLLNNWRQYGTTKALSTFISVLFELTDIFFPVCPTVHTYVFGENCHRKCIFSKTFSRVEIFKKAGFSFTCGRTKTEVFQYDDVIHHVLLAWRMLRKGCYRFSFVLAFFCG